MRDNIKWSNLYTSQKKRRVIFELKKTLEEIMASNFPNLVKVKFTDSITLVKPKQDKCKEKYAQGHYKKTAENKNNLQVKFFFFFFLVKTKKKENITYQYQE